MIRPWLGVKGKFVTEELRTLIALPLVSGLLIVGVEEGSPAEKIGLHAGELDVTIEGEPWVLGGDILVAINNHDVKTAEQYSTVLQSLQAHQTIELRVFKDGIYQNLGVTLGERPTPPSHNNAANPRCLHSFHRRSRSLPYDCRPMPGSNENCPTQPRQLHRE